MSDDQTIDSQHIVDGLMSLAGNIRREVLEKLLPLRQGDITMMFTDIKGSTRLKNLPGSSDEFYFREIMPKHDTLIKKWVSKCGGYVLDTAGDGYFVGFQSSGKALECAIGIQQELEDPATSVPTLNNEHLQVRIGLHTGEAKVHDNTLTGRLGLVGNAVDRAARICSLADGDQLFVSDETRLLVEKANLNVCFYSHGNYELRGLGQHCIVEVLWSNKQAHRPRNGSRSLNRRFLSQFVGRQNELALLREELRRNHLVTLVGPGGVGKSRLAYEAASQFQNDPLFPHGCADVILENLKEKTRRAIVHKFIMDLHLALPENLTPESDANDNNLISVLIAELRGQQALLLIDNCELAPEPIAAVVKSLLEGCPNVRILASSQTPLGLSNLEKIVSVKPMLVPNPDAPTHESMRQLDSYRLFRQRAALNPGWISDDQNLDFEELDCNELAYLLKLTEGLPLVLELVAAWMQYEDVDQIIEDFAASPLGKKSGTPPGTREFLAAERHTSMENCIKWSVELLEPNYQIDFAQLGVLNRIFSPTDMSGACSLTNKVTDLLNRLLSNSLVTRQNKNYLLSRFVHEYATLQLNSFKMSM